MGYFALILRLVVPPTFLGRGLLHIRGRRLGGRTVGGSGSGRVVKGQSGG